MKTCHIGEDGCADVARGSIAVEIVHGAIAGSVTLSLPVSTWPAS
jgi:hypothetical protein